MIVGRQSKFNFRTQLPIRFKVELTSDCPADFRAFPAAATRKKADKFLPDVMR